MSVNAIGTEYRNQGKVAFVTDSSRQKPADTSQVNKLNTEIKQAEAEIKETQKEVQEAVSESVGGISEKAQMLQNKILMEQQTIMTKEIQVDKIESPKESVPNSHWTKTDVKPDFDRYIPEKEDASPQDNVYRLGDQDGNRQIIFNRQDR